MTSSARPEDPPRADPTFPTLHGRPPYGWLNDPNGCARIDGVWHVFYQYNPDAPVHDHICWGHMSSRDLVHWQTEPVALRPRLGKLDQAGCWSGCLTVDDGTPTLVYSAIADRTGASAVALARADLEVRAFRSSDDPAVGMPADPLVTDVRDPYVFQFAGNRYAVQGAGGQPGTSGRILLYACDDLTRWTELGTLLRSDHPVVSAVADADVWECPSLVPIGDHWLLVVSVLHKRDPEPPHLSHAVWIIGDLAETTDGPPSFTPERAGRLDQGPSFYAPQVIEVDGRILMWAWSPELDRTAAETAAAGWAGVLTFPRELDLADDRVVVRPARELTALTGEQVDPSEPLPRAFTATAAPGASISLRLAGQPVWPDTLTVTSVHVDGSLVEAYSRDGTTFTTRGYPTSSHRFTLAGHRHPEITVHALRPGTMG